MPALRLIGYSLVVAVAAFGMALGGPLPLPLHVLYSLLVGLIFGLLMAWLERRH